MKAQVSITISVELLAKLIELKTENHLKTLGNVVDFLSRENARLKILCEKQRETLGKMPGTQEYERKLKDHRQSKPFIGPQAIA